MRLLVIRLSAMGDVAILEPVLRARAKANPDVQFLLAAPPRLQPLFDSIENLTFVPTQKKQSPRQLFRQLNALHPDKVADMHFVNRIIGADLLFRLHGIPVVHINKEKRKRRRMMRKRHKDLSPLTPSWQRYDNVLDACGLKRPSTTVGEQSFWTSSPHKGKIMVGIAPTAQHKGKILPFETMERLIALLSAEDRYEIKLFGGKEEKAMLEGWAEQFPHTQSLAATMSFADELKAIASLDVMVSMDSANMHFASCLGIPCVSIWGATHPNAGFHGWRQDPRWTIQCALPCRPCSPFGKKPCRFGDYRCLAAITAEQIMEKIRQATKS